MFKTLKQFKKDKRGSMMLYATVFGFIAFSIIVGAVSSYTISENRASNYKHNREMAFQIAEAGVAYYRWHLAHDNNDFYDGEGEESTGPYEHEYEDKDGNVIGYFSLEITPPVLGASVVTIESTGWLLSQPNSRRTIKARVGFPSMTDYAFLTKVDAWIGDDEVTHGKFHSNGGIRYDGTGDAPITSAVPEYNCQAHHGCGGGQLKPGIWGDGTPQEYWDFAVDSEDFDVITSKLSDIEDYADTDEGLYLSSSGYQGWYLSFQADGTINIAKVKSTNCYKGKDVGDNKYYWFCVDIKTLDTTTNEPIPENGYIFVNDNVWVDGTVNGRVTIGTAEGKDVIINDDILYLAKDGNYVLGLMSENNVLIPYNSPDDLEINAVMLAQNGAAKRYYYPGDTKDSLTIYGSVITGGTWTWSWVSGGGSVVSGYENTNTTYDANLTYSPPPGFPVGSEYELMSWEEVYN